VPAYSTHPCRAPPPSPSPPSTSYNRTAACSCLLQHQPTITMPLMTTLGERGTLLFYPSAFSPPLYYLSLLKVDLCLLASLLSPNSPSIVRRSPFSSLLPLNHLHLCTSLLSGGHLGRRRFLAEKNVTMWNIGHVYLLAFSKTLLSSQPFHDNGRLLSMSVSVSQHAIL